MTAQEVIKSFFYQLANHGYASSSSVGVNMLDSAVRASSRYSSIQDVIDAMKADQESAEKEAVEEVLGESKLISDVDSDILSAKAVEYQDVYKKSNLYIGDNFNYSSYTLTVKDVINERKATIFLEKYCGIILEKNYWYNGSAWTSWSTDDGLTGNTDTGAITGLDAGGSSVAKTASSVVPEIFINTYTASTSTAQNIITNDRNWVIQATDADDTITANGADSISAGAGNDEVIVNASGATVTSGGGNDFITVSSAVNDITLSDLNQYDTLTISGEFEVGSAQIEDSLLVVTDKTGTRKIRFGDFDNAKSAKINSTKIGNWLIKAGINLDNLKTVNYSEGKVLSNSSVVEVSNTAAAITVDLDSVNTSDESDVVIDGEVVGSLSSTFPNASTFTRNGLTLHLLGVSNSSSGDTSKITEKTLDELTDDQKTIVAGLFKWWIGESLKLSEESFGLSFNSSTAAVKDMGLFFYDSSISNLLAAAPYWKRDEDGSITQLMLKINMNYYSDISADNVDGKSFSTTGYLDRTLAHELTHSIMETNINYFNTLPQFIVEGSAELVHGVDDERGSRIFAIAADASRLNTVLNVNNTSTGQPDYYAGGYMFFRYFAKQAADQTESFPAYGEITATVNLDGDGDYYISGNSTSEIASDSGNIKLGTVSDGVYTVENSGVHQVITNTNNLKIAGLTVNDTLIGSSDADIIETAEGTFINAGGGSDSIKISGQFATIYAGDDNDTVTAEDGSHHFINLGDGDNIVTFKKTRSYKSTVTSGAGDDTIVFDWLEDSSITAGEGADTIYFGGDNNRLDMGGGNDTVYFKYNNMEENFVDLGAGDDKAIIFGGNNTIIGGAGNDSFYSNSTIGNYFMFDAAFGEDTIRGFKTVDTILIPDDFSYNQNASLLTITDKNTGETKGTIELDDFTDTASVVLIKSEIDEESDAASDNSSDDDSDAAEIGDSISNFNGNTIISGTDNNDTISNGGNYVTINAGGGADLIYNYGTDSTITGYSMGKYVVIFAGDDNDTIINSGASSYIYGDAGNDRILNKGISNSIYGGAGNDVISLSSGEESGNMFVYSSGDGKDKIFSFKSNDTIKIVDNSTIEVRINGKDVVLNIDNDKITIKRGTELNSGITVIDSSNNLIADISDNTYTENGIIKGDTIELAPDLTGEFTADSLSVVDGSQLESGMSINAGAQGESLLGGFGKDTLISGEQSNFSLTGGAGNDIFVYKGGVDGRITDYNTSGKDKIVLDGLTITEYDTSTENLSLIFDGVHSLTINNGKNEDIIFGAKNSLTYKFNDDGIFTAKGKAVSIGGNSDSSKRSDSFAALKSYSNVVSIDASAANYEISLTGNKKANRIVAGSNGSTINGGTGKDTLVGNDGRDIFIYEEDSGNKRIENYTYNTSGGDVISLGSGVEIEAIEDRNSDLVLSVGSNEITIAGGAGQAFKFDDGTEKIAENGMLLSSDKKSVSLTASYEGSEFDIASDENWVNFDASSRKKAVNITGDTEDNLLIGSKGGDTIQGGDGEDSIRGGKGNDTLWGGDNSDTFIFNAGDGNDVIKDFNSDDTIDKLLIYDKRGLRYANFKGKYSSKDEALTIAVTGGGKIILENISADSTIMINGEEHNISGKKLK